MKNRLHGFLTYAAIAATALWAGWLIYSSLHRAPGDYAYMAGGRHFADGRYGRALAEYEAALQENPRHLPALRGRAETLIMLGREREAVAMYDRLIKLQPNNPGHYANRGIAHDRLGEHTQALADYDKSLALDPALGEGPGWLTRFLRNQPEKPPGIVDRAEYLRKQLTMPPSKQILRIPPLDQSQHPYKK